MTLNGVETPIRAISAAADFLVEYLEKYEPVVWSAQTVSLLTHLT